MSAWKGKYVIGITGNIATGKSVVRKMLEHLGAFGIDADGLSHQAMGKGGPAYAEVIKIFGEVVVGADGQIDRQLLGNIVFSNPAALTKLEAIIHPAVRQAINILASRASQPVIVIEAIKLLEGELAPLCDSIWVVNAPDDARLGRLTEKRKLTPDQAKARMSAQSPQADKLKQATVVIENGQSYEHTWLQVVAAWNKLLPATLHEPAPAPAAAKPAAAPTPTTVGIAAADEVRIRRGRPGDAAAIAAFINRATHNARNLTREDVMGAFGQKAYIVAEAHGAVVALAGWQVENLVTRVDELYLGDGVPAKFVVRPLLDAIENASGELQSEASFVFVPPALNAAAAILFTESGYETILPDGIGITAWREAVKESQPRGTIVLFKKLREDRVLRPV